MGKLEKNLRGRRERGRERRKEELRFEAAKEYGKRAEDQEGLKE